ncbi:MAG: hypothetical protein HY880_01545 [Deltaproteobacteria bacterium]|nr:hypothetical protein [Deltaproteobacteria bacterium]
MTKAKIKKAQQGLEKWSQSRTDINALRKTYQEKIPAWTLRSMEFEKEPVSMKLLKELLKEEKTVHAR